MHRQKSLYLLITRKFRHGSYESRGSSQFWGVGVVFWIQKSSSLIFLALPIDSGKRMSRVARCLPIPGLRILCSVKSGTKVPHVVGHVGPSGTSSAKACRATLAAEARTSCNSISRISFQAWPQHPYNSDGLRWLCYIRILRNPWISLLISYVYWPVPILRSSPDLVD